MRTSPTSRVVTGRSELFFTPFPFLVKNSQLSSSTSAKAVRLVELKFITSTLGDENHDTRRHTSGLETIGNTHQKSICQCHQGRLHTVAVPEPDGSVVEEKTLDQ